MPSAFRDVIAAVWRRLELSRPSFRADDVAVLTVDGVAITLAASADGRHVLFSAMAGELSENLLVRDQQASRFLKTNAHILLSSRACACLDNSDSQRPMVIVRAALPCSTRFIDAFAEAISDIAHLAGEHARALGTGKGHDTDHNISREYAREFANGAARGFGPGPDPHLRPDPDGMRGDVTGSATSGAKGGAMAGAPVGPAAARPLPNEGLSDDDLLVFRL